MFITILFLSISITIFNITAFFIPKKLKRDEYLSVSVFVLFLQLMVDIVFDVKYDWYGYFYKGVDLEYFIPLFGIFPAFTIILINYFPNRKRLINKSLYIAGATIFCLIYEWLSLKTGYLYHNSWTFVESAVAYPILIVIIISYLYLIQKLKNIH